MNPYPADIHREIGAHLANGRRVVSRAAGRFGEIVEINDGWVRIRLRRPLDGCRYGVTSFLAGDRVKLVNDGKVILVLNDIGASA